VRITEFKIARYGPLREKGIFSVTPFSLFYGRNEEGKTLLIDSIVRLLFKKTRKIFERIERVDELPEGYLLLSTKDKKTVKLPEKGDLTEISGITAGEYRDIFIIRSSDLSIQKEDDTYRNVQSRLTGLKTDEIRNLYSILLSIGRLTPKDEDFRNIKEEKLKERLQRAKEVILKIQKLKESLQEVGYETLEEDSFSMKKQINHIERKRSDFEFARKRETYEKTISSFNSLNISRNELKEFEQYSKEVETLWRDSERDSARLKREIASLVTKRKENEKEVKEIKENLARKEHDFLVYIDRKSILDDEIFPEIKNYEERSQSVARGRVLFKIIGIVDIFFGLLCSLSLFGFIMKNGPFLKISTIISGLFTILLLTPLLWFLIKRFHLAGSLEKIKFSTAKYGLSGDTMNDIIHNITRFKEDCKKMDKERNDLEKVFEVLEREIKDINAKIPQKESEISTKERVIEDIKIESGVDTRIEYVENLKRKIELETVKNEEYGILKSYFGENGRNVKEKLQFWKKKIDDLEEYKNKARHLDFDERSVDELQKTKNTYLEKERVLRKKMERVLNEMKEIEKEVNRSIIRTTEENYLFCKTSVDLEAIEEHLKSFLERNEKKRETILRVKEIFEEIEKEEEEKVSHLFGKESPISRYFSTITDGMYSDVIYDTDTNTIKIFKNKDEFFTPEKLSSGTFDQLYLSIRLALGEKILKGEKGFFLLDDPFIRSDTTRLKRQLEILQELSGTGWQILYFTAKDEVIDCLREEIETKQVSYYEI
jgi:exonuclease SbcC